jgi:DNA-binding GntR family transcriptional regulator
MGVECQKASQAQVSARLCRLGRVPRDQLPPYLAMAADLRSRIERGELQPGEQVPSLDRLAREYDVSRATAQKALRVLRDEGTVETRPRWGTFVAERS